MTLTATLVVGAAILAALVGFGALLWTIVRQDPDKERQSRRVLPYLFLGAGSTMVVSGWFLRTGVIISGVIVMIAGASLAAYGTYLTVRHRGLH